MRILYFFPEIASPMFEWQRVNIFDELSRYNVEIDPFNPLGFSSWEEANEKVLSKANKVCYDLFMTDICHKSMIFKETLDVFKQKGIPTLCFRPDNLLIPFNDQELAQSFDLFWLTSQETSYLYKKWGANVVFQPYAANPFRYVYSPKTLIRKVNFIGRPYGSRPNMINMLTRHIVPVDVFCQNNPSLYNSQSTSESNRLSIQLQPFYIQVTDRLRFSIGRKILLSNLISKIKGEPILEENTSLKLCPRLTFEDMCKTYSNYCLSLASSSARGTDNLSHPVNVVNLRNFEIPMCGGLELCRYSEEMANYFEDGKEIVLYRNDEDLIDKARYYLNAPEREINRIKRNARYKAENEHTWFNRFKKVLGRLGQAI